MPGDYLRDLALLRQRMDSARRRVDEGMASIAADVALVDSGRHPAPGSLLANASREADRVLWLADRVKRAATLFGESDAADREASAKAARCALALLPPPEPDRIWELIRFPAAAALVARDVRK